MKRKVLFLLSVLVICAVCTFTVLAASSPSHLVDNADLFTSEQEKSLASGLDKVSKKYDIDVVVLTVNSLDNKDLVAYADDYYDYNGYKEDGMLLLIAVEEDERYVSTCGSCIDKIKVSELGDRISGYLDNGDYAQAVNGLVDYVNDAYSFKFLLNLAICLIIGFVIALVVTGVMKSKLKSVRRQANAASYQKAGSFKVTVSRDIFLYRNVIRRARPKNNGGGRTHTSSSGRSHGGGRI